MVATHLTTRGPFTTARTIPSIERRSTSATITTIARLYITGTDTGTSIITDRIFRLDLDSSQQYFPPRKGRDFLRLTATIQLLDDRQVLVRCGEIE
jgi:hypothetical protein